MAVVARYIADKSALARLNAPPVAVALIPLIEAGLVATCAVIDLEVLWSTRSAAEFAEVRRNRVLGFEWLPTHDEDWTRALDVQQELWSRGQVRSVGFPDLLIAAVAEREGVTVLHYDSDFDMIAAVTAQPVQWIVQRGTVE
jgi:predicted nucleic acid-binding protein